MKHNPFESIDSKTKFTTSLKGEENADKSPPSPSDAPEEDGIGLNEKAPTFSLELDDHTDTIQSLLYGSIRAIVSDGSRNWIRLTYEGNIIIDGKEKLGCWWVEIIGINMTMIRRQIGKSTRSVLSIGGPTKHEKPITVSAFTITEAEIVVMGH